MVPCGSERVVRFFQHALESTHLVLPLQAVQHEGEPDGAYRGGSEVAQRSNGHLEDYEFIQGNRLAERPTRGDYFEAGWREVNITHVAAATGHVWLDLTPLNGARPLAVRYAWGVLQDNNGGVGSYAGEKLCCRDAGDLIGITKPCEPASCALMASGGLPANPFLARIVDGRCKCLEPQICDG